MKLQGHVHGIHDSAVSAVKDPFEIPASAGVPAEMLSTVGPLGTKLHLPPWFEEQRAAIVAQLEPITVPEENRPKSGATSAPRPATAAHKSAAEPAIPVSRTKAAFETPKQPT